MTSAWLSSARKTVTLTWFTLDLPLLDLSMPAFPCSQGQMIRFGHFLEHPLLSNQKQVEFLRPAPVSPSWFAQCLGFLSATLRLLYNQTLSNTLGAQLLSIDGLS